MQDVDFFAEMDSKSEAILKRYEIEGQNVILYFDEVNINQTVVHIACNRIQLLNGMRHI